MKLERQTGARPSRVLWDLGYPSESSEVLLREFKQGDDMV